MKIAIPDLVSNSYFPAIAAVDLGFFKEEGLDMELELIFPVDHTLEKLRDGEIDFVGGSAHSTPHAFPKWNGGKLLGALAQGMYWFLILRSDLGAKQGDIEAVKQHLAAGTDVNGGENSPPLFYATTKEVLELLIANGVDVNAQNTDGETPLLEATYGGHKNIVELLISKGADVNANNAGGDTPLDYAIRLKRTEIATLLRKQGGKTGEGLKAEGK